MKVWISDLTRMLMMLPMFKRKFPIREKCVEDGGQSPEPMI
ncbi:MAG: hypothetical protein AAF609_08160 [Cyanobacteria bacterium P01_C01_bin.120]